jgi:dCTP diphosphatase
MKRDDETTIQELKDLVAQFRDERGWSKHHQPRNLAVSIAVEAAELLEHFQWGEYSTHDKQEVADELADILLYCFNLAGTLDIDVATAYRDKLERAKKKFPTEIFNPGHDDPAEYKRIKAEYRREGKK